MRKNIIFFTILLALVVSIPSAAFAYYDTIRVEVTEVPYRPVHAFLGLNFEGGVNNIGGSMFLLSARPSDFQLAMRVGYSSNTTGTRLGMFDVMLGGCYFPRRPTFGLGDIAVRLLIYGLGGMGMTSDFGMVFAGLAGADLFFSSGDDPSGLFIGCAYKSGVMSSTATLPDTVVARAGFLFAP